MEKNIPDMKFVEWYRELCGQNVHPVTAKKAFWESQNPQKYEHAGIESTNLGYHVFRDPVFRAARDYPAFDEAVVGLQEAVGYSTNRNIIIYSRGNV